MKSQRINVLFFLNRFPIPSETFVVDQICGLIDRNIDVSIISVSKGDYVNVNEKVREYELDRKTIYLVDNSKHKVLGRLATLKLSIIKPKILKLLNVFKYGSVAKNLLLPITELKKTEANFDYIIAHFGTAGVTAMKIKKAGVLSGKLLPVFHGADISKKKHLAQYEQDYKELFKESYALLPISNLWATKLVELGAMNEKIMVNRMGIDTNHFSFVNKAGKSSHSLTILSVARLVEKKGLDDAIKAMSLLAKTDTSFTYEIVGGGELFDELKTLVRELNLEKQVIFHGVKSQLQVRKILEMADVFLLPSKVASDGDMEGIPVSLMESMASGITTLSTYHSGIPELIDSGKNGFLVPEASPEEIYKTLLKISNNEFDIDAIRASALEKVSTEFNQSKIYDQLAQFLMKNLKSNMPSYSSKKSAVEE